MYLVAILEDNGRQDCDINQRINKTCKLFYVLNGSLSVREKSHRKLSQDNFQYHL